VAIDHYLLTITLPDGHLHGYVMTDDESVVPRVLDKMMMLAEMDGRFLPIILQTKLDDGANLVRTMISDLNPECKQALATATNFHLSIWFMENGHADDSRLMDLH
jgi:hypothetical protein